MTTVLCAVYDTVVDETMHSKGDQTPAPNWLSNFVLCFFSVEMISQVGDM